MFEVELNLNAFVLDEFNIEENILIAHSIFGKIDWLFLQMDLSYLWQS